MSYKKINNNKNFKKSSLESPPISHFPYVKVKVLILEEQK